MTRVAVIGCGTVSVVHLAAIETIGAELVGVCDIDPARAPGGYRDHRAMLDELRPDVVHICTPHDQHVPVAIDALERGAHVLLEKPVAHTVEEAERLVAAAKAFPDRKIGVCLQNRYNATSIAAREHLRDSPPRSGSATVLWHRDPSYYRDSPWRGRRERSGGGVLINQAIHTLDLLQWLLGDVESVASHTGRYGDFPGIDVEDTAHALLGHAGGARSVFFATVTNATDSPVTIEIVTDETTLLIRGDLTVTHAGGRTEVTAERRAGTAGRNYWGVSHELLIADFYRSLGSPEPFWIGPEEALRSQRIVDQIYCHHS
ncbi:Gfo/Idh/MocA family protein [Paractinoplanes toevensis]|uniref:Dehydrogenase n=1 Tax=Paractinoplanes toevensis TaxID=571911 RepID=A0A919W3F0_9ACTN|nr:Gfo/Idh/MocA family oxidoreductase [Actinoplanes toevensis]GIM94697.1 dehydrogenase [Actinoplanes toevensis]